MQGAPVPDGPERIVYEGKMFEVVKQPMRIGDKIVEFETARRAPGVRIIIVKDNKMLLSKEYRFEQKDWDYRLPGGKVFDTLQEYREALANDGDLLKHADVAAKRECEEEVAITPKKMRHIYTTTPSASVVLGLYYFVVEEFEEHPDGQKLEHGEVIHPAWKTFDEVKKLCLDGGVKEEFTVAVLLRFLLKN